MRHLMLIRKESLWEFMFIKNNLIFKKKIKCKKFYRFSCQSGIHGYDFVVLINFPCLLLYILYLTKLHTNLLYKPKAYISQKLYRNDNILQRHELNFNIYFMCNAFYLFISSFMSK